MSRTACLRGALVLACLAAAPVLGPAPALAQQASGGQPSSYMMNDHHLRASQLVGKPVFNDKGETIGTIAEVLVDMKGGPVTVVLNVGKYVGGSKMVAAPLDHLKLEGDRAMMAGADRQMLLRLPNYTYDPMVVHGPTG